MTILAHSSSLQNIFMISNSYPQNMVKLSSESLEYLVRGGREIAAGQIFLDSHDIVDFLTNKFQDSNQGYIFQEIDERELDIQRAEAGRKKYPIIDGSSKFQAMVFTPNSTSFNASHLKREINNGSYSNFREYQLIEHP